MTLPEPCLKPWGFCLTIHSRWFSMSSMGWGLGNSKLNWWKSGKSVCLSSLLCILLVKPTWVDGSFEIHVSKSGDHESTLSEKLLNLYMNVFFKVRHGINIPNLAFPTKRFCRHSKPSKLPNPQGFTKASPYRHIDEVPILLPDDVLLPFFIRLGYTNLQDLLLSPESNAIKCDQMRWFMNLWYRFTMICLWITQWIRISITIMIFHKRIASNLFYSMMFSMFIDFIRQSLMLVRHVCQDFRYQSPGWTVPAEDSRRISQN